MPDVENNPAQRLLRLLKKGKEHSLKKATKTVWAELLDVPHEDTALLLRRIGFVLQLPSEIRKEISAVEEDPGLYLKHLQRIESALITLDFKEPWSVFIKKIDEASLHGLEFCDLKLSRLRRTGGIESMQLSELQKEAQGLIQEISESDSPSELRALVLGHLSDIDQAIQEYPISGAKALRGVTLSAAGDFLRNSKLKQQTWWNRLWDFLNKTAVVLTIITAPGILSEYIPKLLPESGSVEQVDPASRFGDTVDGGDEVPEDDGEEELHSSGS